jgi:phosphatidylglycerophosphatase A
MRFIHYAIATTFGLGYSPTAPGTAGTLFGLAVCYFGLGASTPALILVTILVFAVGTYSAHFVEKDHGKHDPSIVVVDEVAGMMLGLWFVPVAPLPYLVAFGLFRLFDVSKLFPVNKLQDLSGGWGIMLDDIGAGVYTLLIMQALLYFQVL